jgi:hypothetical protein
MKYKLLKIYWKLTKFQFQGVFCDDGNKVVTFTTTKRILAVIGSGTLRIHVQAKHDSGSSCFEAELSIRKDAK